MVGLGSDKDRPDVIHTVDGRDPASLGKHEKPFLCGSYKGIYHSRVS